MKTCRQVSATLLKQADEWLSQVVTDDSEPLVMDLLANFDGSDESTAEEPIIGEGILSDEHDLKIFEQQLQSAKRNMVSVSRDRHGPLPKAFIDEYY